MDDSTLYQLSDHAIQRIKQRKLRIEWLLAALDGERVVQGNGTVMLCDPATRCTLIVDPNRNLIITALRLRPAKYKRIFSRRKHHGRYMGRSSPTRSRHCPTDY